MSILVVGITCQQNSGSATLSMVSAARALGALDGTPFDLLLLGAGAKDAGRALTCFGAANIYYSEEASVTDYTAGAHASAVATVVWNNAYSTVILPANSNGNNLTQMLAQLMNGTAISHVTGFEADGHLTCGPAKEHCKIQSDSIKPGNTTTFLTVDEAAFEQAKEVKGGWAVAPTELLFEVDDC